MTFREKLTIEHPYCVDKCCPGGCFGCPGNYGYEPESFDCTGFLRDECTACWNREIPEGEEEETAAAGANFESDPANPSAHYDSYEQTVEDIRVLQTYVRDDYIKAVLRRAADDIEELLKAAKAMHTWIFLHTGDEQAAYDECGLTDEMNAMLGYGGQFVAKLPKEKHEQP